MSRRTVGKNRNHNQQDGGGTQLQQRFRRTNLENTKNNDQGYDESLHYIGNKTHAQNIQIERYLRRNPPLKQNKIIERLRHELQQVQHKVVEELARTDLYQHTTSY